SASGRAGRAASSGSPSASTSACSERTSRKCRASHASSAWASCGIGASKGTKGTTGAMPVPRCKIKEFRQRRGRMADSPVASRRQALTSYRLNRMPRKQLQKGFPLMSRFWSKAALAALVAIPMCAAAFDAVDVLPSASSGLYPAYPGDPIPPYALWAQAGLMYDSNILRRPTGDNNEWLTRVGIGGRMDQRVIGRQGLHLEGRLDGYLYDKFSDLDNVSYSALGEWRYEVGNDLAGALGVSRRRFQAALSEIQRDLYDPITESSLNGTARYALGPHLALRGAAHWIDYVRPSRPFSNTRTVILGGGLDYVTDLGN